MKHMGQKLAIVALSLSGSWALRFKLRSGDLERSVTVLFCDMLPVKSVYFRMSKRNCVLSETLSKLCTSAPEKSVFANETVTVARGNPSECFHFYV
jgi:hypothetical protein